MSFFNSIEVSPDVLPFIQQAKGVGVVKVNNIGKCSSIIDQNKLILNPYDSNNIIAIPIAEINLIQYDKGNFINEPKLTVGAGGSQFVLAGVDNNDDELNAFYETLLDMRQNQEKLLKNNNQSKNPGMPIPNKNITNPNKLLNTENNFQQIKQPKNNFVPEESEPQQEIDAVDEIRRYYELKEDGIISEEEFNQKKKQLLNI